MLDQIIVQFKYLKLVNIFIYLLYRSWNIATEFSHAIYEKFTYHIIWINDIWTSHI